MRDLALANRQQIVAEIQRLEANSLPPTETPEKAYSQENINFFAVKILSLFLEKKEEIQSLSVDFETASQEETHDFTSQAAKQESVANISASIKHLRQYLQKLEEVWVMCLNKRYGICTKTGKPINFKRLLAAPASKQEVLQPVLAH